VSLQGGEDRCWFTWMLACLFLFLNVAKVGIQSCDEARGEEVTEEE
jgi:hypothetical protein